MRQYCMIMVLVGATLLLTSCDVITEEAKTAIEETVEVQLEEMKEDVTIAVKEAVTEAVEAEVDAIKEDAANSLSNLGTSMDATDIGEVEAEEVSKVAIVVSYPDENATCFLVKEVLVPTSDSWVQESIDALIVSDLIPSDVQVVDYGEENGIMTIHLSEEFLIFLNTLGENGEYMYLGSVVNTLLEAGHLEGVTLLINQEYLETRYGIYDTPLSQFPDQVVE
ncbi:MAG: GerMN domain-containing protein [Eubacteriales bacterium]